MTEDDRERFGELITLLGEVFNEPVSAARSAGYWMALEDLSLARVGEATQHAIRHCKFFPRPGELREFAGAGIPDAGSINALVVEYFGRLGTELRRADDPFVALVVKRLGGTFQARQMTGETLLRLIVRILPGAVTTALVRGIPMPTEAALLNQRRIEANGRDEG